MGNLEYFEGDGTPKSHYVGSNQYFSDLEAIECLEENGIDVSSVEYIESDQSVASEFDCKYLAIFHETN